jgi:hypothetical protein
MWYYNGNYYNSLREIRKTHLLSGAKMKKLGRNGSFILINNQNNNNHRELSYGEMDKSKQGHSEC